MTLETRVLVGAPPDARSRRDDSSACRVPPLLGEDTEGEKEEACDADEDAGAEEPGKEDAAAAAASADEMSLDGVVCIGSDPVREATGRGEAMCDWADKGVPS